MAKTAIHVVRKREFMVIHSKSARSATVPSSNREPTVIHDRAHSGVVVSLLYVGSNHKATLFEDESHQTLDGSLSLRASYADKPTLADRRMKIKQTRFHSLGGLNRILDCRSVDGSGRIAQLVRARR